MALFFLWNFLRSCLVARDRPNSLGPNADDSTQEHNDQFLISGIELEMTSQDSRSSRTFAESPRSIKFPHITSQLSEFSATEQEFLLNYPSYHSALLDSIRHTEFRRLEQLTYLDYTGAALYPESLVIDSHEFLVTTVLGNPHSSNPSSVTFAPILSFHEQESFLSSHISGPK